MTLDVRTFATPDDGETRGFLHRPVGGFRLAEIAGETWLVPVRPFEPFERVGWPRGRVSVLDAFADLHRRPDAAVARFASTHGWLGHGSLIPVDPGEDYPALKDQVSAWRHESRCLSDLLDLVRAARLLRRGESAMYRTAVLANFQVKRSRGPEIQWAGAGESGGLVFPWGRAEIVVPVPLPVKVGPAWHGDLEHGPRQDLVELALYAAGCAAQTVLTAETHGTLTLAKGIRVAPTTLLGALYLTFAAELFERKEEKTCPVCRTRFIVDTRSDRVYDTDACRAKAYYERKKSTKRGRQP